MAASSGGVAGRAAPLFGSSGIRGVVGEDLTEQVCEEVGWAVGTLLSAGSRVCIATDTRLSRDLVRDAVSTGLRAAGVEVTEIGILPTPALAFLTGDMGFDAGVMVTASHNPPGFNGIKLFTSERIGYSRQQEAEIERLCRERSFRTAPRGTLRRDHTARERYLGVLAERFKDRLPVGKARVVVDAGNGAAAGFASELFTRLGLDVIAVNDAPDGGFPGRGPEPREDTLRSTAEIVRSHNAALGVCFDGDADRVVFLDKQGFPGFNEAVAAVARLVLGGSSSRKAVATVETGMLLDLALEGLGVEVVRGRVGDVHVAQLVRELDAGIGVEPVGVYIIPEMGLYPDSVFAALTVLIGMDGTGELFRQMPRLHYDQGRVPCANDLKEAVMAEVLGRVDDFGARSVNTLDGLRLEFAESWLLIRASGTEPLVRVVAESGSRTETERLVRWGVEVVKKTVSGLET